MALSLRRKPARSRPDGQSHLGEMPAPLPHRPIELPEEHSSGSNGKDVLATVLSALLFVAGTALLTWLAYAWLR